MTLRSADPYLKPYREALALAGGDPRLTSLLLHAKEIPGMCSDEKIKALYRIGPQVPRGDVVEIGTWWGKSAFVLLMLARWNSIGNVLCVDPWSDAELAQGVPEVDEASARMSAQEAFEIFVASLIPYAFEDNEYGSDFNYLRSASSDAHQWYRREVGRPMIESEFKETMYSGRIALLHVDGNHAYDKVKQDLDLWVPLVVPGGWVVVDDYDWEWGDGPRRAADELIASLDSCGMLLAGGAQFIQLGGRK